MFYFVDCCTHFFLPSTGFASFDFCTRQRSPFFMRHMPSAPQLACSSLPAQSSVNVALMGKRRTEGTVVMSFVPCGNVCGARQAEASAIRSSMYFHYATSYLCSMQARFQYRYSMDSCSTAILHHRHSSTYALHCRRLMEESFTCSDLFNQPLTLLKCTLLTLLMRINCCNRENVGGMDIMSAKLTAMYLHGDIQL